MSRHERTLERIFRHPIAMNVKWTEVTNLVRSLGGTVEPAHGGREKVRLNDQEFTFHVPHGSAITSKDEMMQIRRFLARAGVSPPAKREKPA